MTAAKYSGYSQGIVCFACWNLQGKGLAHFNNWYNETGECMDIFCLQEVGQLQSLSTLKEFEEGVFEYSLQEPGELRSFYVVGTTATSAHLGQVILLHKDNVELISNAWRGERFIAAEVVLSGTQHRICIVSCHLPHQARPIEEFEESLRQLVQCLVDHQDTPIIFMGDFNCEPGTERGVMLDACFSTRGGKIVRTDMATRFGHASQSELDYTAFNKAFQQIVLPEAAAIDTKALQHSRIELGSDHCCVTCEVSFHDPRACVVKPARVRRTRNKCRRWSVDPSLVETTTPQVLDKVQGLDITGQWEVLKQHSTQVSRPAPSLKYRDSDTLKDLCHRRRITVSMEDRATLTRRILSLRHIERTMWMQQLYERSRQGDTGAIRYLRQRNLPVQGSIHSFLSNSGGATQAGQRVQEHYEALFSKREPADDADLEACLQTFREQAQQSHCQEFSVAEVQKGVDRLKRSKVTGPSGMSNEYLLGLWGIDSGKDLLLCVLNQLLKSPALPQDFYRAHVALLPKAKEILSPKDYRPINLIEALHKLYSWLLVARLQPGWSTPRLQKGGVKGSQVCDALSSAQARVTKESKTRQYNIYLSCDISAAFDNLRQSAVARFLLEQSPRDRLHESWQLLQLILHPSLEFQWLSREWKVDQVCGLQQGGSHSAVVFSYVLGRAVQYLEEKWSSDGEECQHSSFFLLFVDDILATFKDWSQASRLVSQLIEFLASLGLALNPSKTKVMSHESVLRAGADFVFPPSCFLRDLSWGTECLYLKKRLTHFETGAQATQVGFADSTAVMLQSLGRATHVAFESLKQALRRGHWCCPRKTIQLCNQYLGATWFWYSPVMEPLQKYLVQVRSMQVTFLTLMLGLCVPSSFGPPAAASLNRTRRRAVLVLLNWFVACQWVHIWVKRRWGYLGHVLRFPEDNVTRVDLLALSNTKQAAPGPWRHLHAWGMSCLNVDAQQLSDRARDREAWTSYTADILDKYAYHHPIFNPATASNWRDTVRLHTPWRLAVHVCVASAGWTVMWIDEEYGLQEFTRLGQIQEVLQIWLLWIQLEFEGLVIDVHLQDWMQQCFYSELVRFHESTFRSFNFLILYSVIPETWAEKLSRLL